ncbi:MAG: glycosyltransferase [Anaerolineae bacterium]|nr:glycosyltransferase [Anaerolineae bacterium]
MSQPRIALYSHDTLGLGHIRRNLSIATALAETKLRPTSLLITGAREAASFSLPPGVDCLSLPAVGKSDNGDYHSRRLSVPFSDLIELRSETIYAGLKSFKPDLLIVDKVPLGAFGELLKSLDYLRQGRQTRIVLGLRDILDESAAARREWSDMGYERAIHEFYDAVWVYGDPLIFNPVREYSFSLQIQSKIRYTGYLCRADKLLIETLDTQAKMKDLPDNFALCLLGGGQDGYRLGSVFAQSSLPPEMSSVIVAGPYMPPGARQRLHEEAAGRSHVSVLDFVAEPEPLLKKSTRVIAMGGYNTMCDILALHKSALIVPRIAPRQEQYIRAKLFSNLGLIDLLHPSDLEPGRLENWLSAPAHEQHYQLSRPYIDGLRRVATLTGTLLNRPV